MYESESFRHFHAGAFPDDLLGPEGALGFFSAFFPWLPWTHSLLLGAEGLVPTATLVCFS